MLRKPLPNGVFRSGFGGRQHPILGIAPNAYRRRLGSSRGLADHRRRATLVEKAGWVGGYGRQTIIRHANGYETSYNHQSGIVRGIKPGVSVRQGQVIGFVGSTGLSTGPHLHYELIVNGRKVDPLRVRLPTGRTLDGPDLVSFNAERARIDELLREEKQGPPLKVASK